MRENDLALLRRRLEEIKAMGWVQNARPGNAGGVGNTLEDLLDVAENNLQLPDFGAWELKSQRKETAALLTLFHSEPKPRKARIVPKVLLPYYGWAHQDAGMIYQKDERSFRQTIHAAGFSDRGFKVNVDYAAGIVFVSFDFAKISDKHAAWREFVQNGVGTGDISPHPYWTFDDIDKKLKTKICNLMYVQADTKWENGGEYFRYQHFEAYVDPSLECFLHLLERGDVYVDFDARTGHNHGTKFRIKPLTKKEIYQNSITV